MKAIEVCNFKVCVEMNEDDSLICSVKPEMNRETLFKAKIFGLSDELEKAKHEMNLLNNILENMQKTEINWLGTMLLKHDEELERAIDRTLDRLSRGINDEVGYEDEEDD